MGQKDELHNLCWRIYREKLSLLVEIWSGLASVETSMEMSQKNKRITIWPSNIYLLGSKIIHSKGRAQYYLLQHLALELEYGVSLTGQRQMSG